ncbi:MAG: Phosphoglucomutase/phosphomannomutase alpha/beta/alpha domain I [Candidatus Wolfebacteria bacterium GW2011_GWE2_44_13]|uniref:Phosphoglucomutase/phosphomannomutase alpha/beta/alpha domain I n=1 Tax=Candidatus Wolfebacteria bacterium GW2011_GWE2_44_13 TaxID=1619017 RepID=A0A0G1K765_9BACT|nr:MAG: Phosphoglucomutase/phosphomannomutase alpha/beta/alpha domain I [Candidatus Wolfebacteria bacterium GW2011_GWE2_44_13]
MKMNNLRNAIEPLFMGGFFILFLNAVEYKYSFMKNDNQLYTQEYVAFLSNYFCACAKHIPSVFDCSNGSTGPIIEQLFSDAIIINGRPDGNFPHHAPDPLHKGSLVMLQKKVLSERADVGIIFDADGDRAFFIDNKGRFVDPNVIAYLLLWSLRPKHFISDVKAGWLIKRHPFESKRIESKTGHYFIKQAMRKWNADFGHEESGHYYFRDFFYCDSGIFAAIAVLHAIAQLPYTLAEFVDLLPVTHASGEINFPISVAKRGTLLQTIENHYKKDAARVSKIDGIAVEFKNPDWWFTVRFSNTESLARLNVEALDKKVLDKQVRKLTELIKRAK